MKKPIGYITGKIKQADKLNPQIEQGFYSNRDTDIARKTHLFGGRYENIYIPESAIPELGEVLSEIRMHAASVLNMKPDDLKLGFWFNEMQPGDVTTLHSHDDFDELLSAVYYVKVPGDSGHIVFHEPDQKKEIPPEEGMYILFSPELKHEVTENRSAETRISIGINIGPMEQE